MTRKPTEEAFVWAECAAEAALSKKAHDVRIVQVGPALIIVDYFVIATAENSIQFKAITEAVEEALRKEYGLKPIGREGVESASWALLDFGDVVVHVFAPETRDFYRLESLYNDAQITAYEEAEVVG